MFQWSYTPYWQMLRKDFLWTGIIMHWTPSLRGQTDDRCQGDREASAASASSIMYQQENMTSYMTKEECDVWWDNSSRFHTLGKQQGKKSDADSFISEQETSDTLNNNNYYYY